MTETSKTTRQSNLRSLRDDRGSSAVEFALIAPVLVLLIAGIIEGSLLFFTWGNMEYVGRQAARAAAIGEFTKAQAESFIVAQMKKSIGEPTVDAAVTFVTGTSNEVRVQVSVPASQLTAVQPFGLFRMLTLNTQVTMHKEAS
jgi:Flp pilus assembly protein TadG